tara:strand:+ start:628 stop:735 length:108 start_codon:yes stop_codon:yes gene_type:complete
MTIKSQSAKAFALKKKRKKKNESWRRNAKSEESHV